METERRPMELPRELFKHRSADEQISQEQTQFTPIEKLTWDNGIFLYPKGAEYPQKGMATTETMWALNTAKRFLMEGLRLLTKWYFVPTYVIIAILPWYFKRKIIEQFLWSYTELSWRQLSPFILKTNYLTPIAQEIEWGVYTFLRHLGFKEMLCDRFSEVFAALIEYDNAYRFRAQDVLSETTNEALYRKPITEMVRLSKLLVKRDKQWGTAAKFTMVVMILRIALIHPKFRKAFKAMIKEIDVKKLGLDEADRYWVCMREDYNFLGKSDDERKELIKDKKKPELITRKW